MPTQKAVEIVGPRDAEFGSGRHNEPQLRDDYIFIKTYAKALNPTCWKPTDFIVPTGSLSGCDYAGVIEEGGARVKKSFKTGDRVCGDVPWSRCAAA